MGDGLTAGNGNGCSGQVAKVLRIDHVECAVDHGGLPPPHEVGVEELVHPHPTGAGGLVPVGSKLRHTLVAHHLHVEGEQQHGVGVGGHLAHVPPVARLRAHTDLLLQLRGGCLGACVAGLHETGHEGFVPETGLDAARFQDHVPRALLGVVPEHDSHRDRVGGYPALPLAVPEPEELAPSTAERHALAALGVHEARLARVHHGSRCTADRTSAPHRAGGESTKRAF